MNTEEKITILKTAIGILEECLADKGQKHKIEVQYGFDPQGVCDHCDYVDIECYISWYIHALREHEE